MMDDDANPHDFNQTDHDERTLDSDPEALEATLNPLSTVDRNANELHVKTPPPRENTAQNQLAESPARTYPNTRAVVQYALESYPE